MALTAIAFWITYCVGLVGALVYPLAGVLLYILVYHLNPETQWWGDSVRATGLRMSMTVAVATIIGIILKRPQLGRGGRQFTSIMALAVFLVLLAWTSFAWGDGPNERGLYQAEKFGKVLIFVLLMIRCVSRPEHYHLLIATWLLGVLYIGYEAFGQVGVSLDGRLTQGLGGPDFNDSGSLALHLLVSLPFIGAMFFMERSWWTRGILLAIGALAVNTIVLTRTRSAMVGIAAICFVGILSLPRGYRMKGFLAVVVGLVLSVQLTDPGWWRRMRTISEYTADVSAMRRFDYWYAALEMVRDQPLGVGFGNFEQAVQRYVPHLNIPRCAHNTYLEIMAELGFLGLGLLVIIFTVTMHTVNRLRKRARYFESRRDIIIGGRWRTRFDLAWHAMALRCSLAGYFVCAIFDSRVVAEDLWILIGFACCLANITAHMLNTADDQDELAEAAEPEPHSYMHGRPSLGHCRTPHTT
ncbi:MAG: O-antigen ligase family protein [Phycisphaerae bacterium]|nr:O-antigen ligase family protein [Phycisphaerae bacterium]